MADGMKDSVALGDASVAGSVDLSSEGTRILPLVFETFGEMKGQVWLTRQNRVLDNETPLNMLRTDKGALAVETLLHRIAHGLGA